jgi:hypothetical protein
VTTRFYIYDSILLTILKIRNISQILYIKSEQNFTFDKFFRKSRRLLDNLEKYGTAREATDDNIVRRMRFSYCITKATRARAHAHRMCNTYGFSIATVIPRPRVNVTLYVE